MIWLQARPRSGLRVGGWRRGLGHGCRCRWPRVVVAAGVGHGHTPSGSGTLLEVDTDAVNVIGGAGAPGHAIGAHAEGVVSSCAGVEAAWAVSTRRTSHTVNHGRSLLIDWPAAWLLSTLRPPRQFTRGLAARRLGDAICLLWEGRPMTGSRPRRSRVISSRPGRLSCARRWGPHEVDEVHLEDSEPVRCSGGGRGGYGRHSQPRRGCRRGRRNE